MKSQFSSGVHNSANSLLLTGCEIGKNLNRLFETPLGEELKCVEVFNSLYETVIVRSFLLLTKRKTRDETES